jgi:glycosyltransferase involved in cell wall biosynthesis
MPRVLQIVNRLNLGGVVSNALYLAKYMPEGFESRVVAGMIDESEGNYEFLAREMGIEPIYIQDMYREVNFSLDRKAYRAIKQVIRDFKPDVVHTHSAKAGALGRLAASACGVPAILHTFHGHVFHSYFSPLKTRVFLEIERYLARKSSAIIGIGEQMKHEVAEVYKVCPPEKVRIVRYGYDLSMFTDDQEKKRAAFRSTYNLNDDEIAIGIIGRIVPIKNHSLFLNALKRVLEATDKPVRAFIIGDGEDRQKTEALARELGIAYTTEQAPRERKPLTFTSWIKEIDQAIAGLDLIALTSLNEGTPVSLIEAQAAGKPIATTVVGGVPDTIIDGETALSSPSQDAAAFASNLLQLVEDEALRQQLGARGAKFAQDRYSYQTLIHNMSSLYLELLGQE